MSTGWPSSVLIRASREIRGTIETSLKKNAGVDYLLVVERNGEWTLPDKGGFLFDDGHGTWALHPLGVKSAADRQYLFALRVRFLHGREQERYLTSASMMVAVRLASNELWPVVRAELDANGSPHAQPHWHVYGRQLRDSVRGSLASHFDAEFFGSPRIHWAMCAKWPERGGDLTAHALDFARNESLARWLGGCIGYVRAQLDYVESKMPPTPENLFERIAADTQSSR